jgi:penicillin-binding protein 1C
LLGLSASPEAATGGKPIVVLDRSESIELARLEPGTHKPQDWKAPHFVLQVLAEAERQLCGRERMCAEWRQGGLRIVSTLVWRYQQQAEEELASNVRAKGELSALGVNNGALAALDYQTGEILAYAGSAGFSAARTPRFQPEFDVLSQARRQTGSIFKPFVYLPGLETGEFTPATLFLDAMTEIEPGYVPKNSDDLERGPVRLRDALAYSLNIPAVKAAVLLGEERIRQAARRFGIEISAREPDPGPAIALGVFSCRPIEMLSAFGAFANAGELSRRTAIRRLERPDGRAVPMPTPSSQVATTPQAAFLVTEMLARETLSKSNPYLGGMAVRDRLGKRRAVAVKTGTSDGGRDLWTVGYLPPPAEKAGHAVAAILWLGNSDGSATRVESAREAAAPIWHSFVSSVAARATLKPFGKPDGVSKARIDATSGFKPGPWTRQIRREWFLDGTLPLPDPTKVRLPQDGEEVWAWNLAAITTERPAWRDDAEDWAARVAKGGSGVASSHGTRTSYFFDQRFQPYGQEWGGALFPEPPDRRAALRY